MKTLAILLAIVVTTVAAQGAVYSGTLTGGAGGGIFATDGWNSTLTSLTYTVTVPEGPGLVNYKYEFSVPTKGISHLIIEVSDNFTEDDIFPFGFGDLDTYSAETQGGSNPGMPSPMYGVKFEDIDGDELNWVVEFDSTRLPTWGDFYSKDGVDPTTGQIDVYAYNSGFGADPPAYPQPGYVPWSNTPYNNKILVPDTYIPEPATLLVLGLGLMLGLARRRARGY